MQYLRQQADQSVRTTTLCFRLRVEHTIFTSVIRHKNYRIKFMSFELTPPPRPLSLTPPPALTSKTILIPDSPISHTCFLLEIQRTSTSPVYIEA